MLASVVAVALSFILFLLSRNKFLIDCTCDSCNNVLGILFQLSYLPFFTVEEDLIIAK